MNMEELVWTLQNHVVTPKPNFGDGESVLALLYEAYADCNALYRLMNGMELREMDKKYLPCLYPLPGSSTIGIY